MTFDPLDRLRAVDPAAGRSLASTEPDWESMAGWIVDHPRRGGKARRRLKLVFAPVVVAAVLAAGVGLVGALNDDRTPSVVERAYAAVSKGGIYHYVSVFRELEGPERQPVPGARSRNEGWIDPQTGEIREVGPGGDEWTTDGRIRRSYFGIGNVLTESPEPSESQARRSSSASNNVFEALTKAYGIDSLEDQGTAIYRGREVYKLVAVSAERTFRQTFLIDTETYYPVLWTTESGDYVKNGGPVGPGQRIMETYFERFERLPDNTDRSVLQIGPHSGAKTQVIEVVKNGKGKTKVLINGREKKLP